MTWSDRDAAAIYDFSIYRAFRIAQGRGCIRRNRDRFPNSVEGIRVRRDPDSIPDTRHPCAVRAVEINGRVVRWGYPVALHVVERAINEFKSTATLAEIAVFYWRFEADPVRTVRETAALTGQPKSTVGDCEAGILAKLRSILRTGDTPQ